MVYRVICDQDVIASRTSNQHTVIESANRESVDTEEEKAITTI